MEWWSSVEDSTALPLVATPSSVCPHLYSLTPLTGAAFRLALADVQSGSKAHMRVIAMVRGVPLKYGPLFYSSCPTTDGKGGRACQKRVDTDNSCPKCGVVVEPVPFLSMSRASFIADDGERFRMSALGPIAERILGIDASQAAEWEAESIRTSDSNRKNQETYLSSVIGKRLDFAVSVDHILIDGNTPFISATVYDIAEPTSMHPDQVLSCL